MQLFPIIVIGKNGVTDGMNVAKFVNKVLDHFFMVHHQVIHSPFRRAHHQLGFVVPRSIQRLMVAAEDIRDLSMDLVEVALLKAKLSNALLMGRSL